MHRWIKIRQWMKRTEMFWGAFGKQRESKLMWRRVADCSRHDFLYRVFLTIYTVCLYQQYNMMANQTKLLSGRLYFGLTITNTSIWTTLPMLPRTSSVCISFQAHTSLKYWYHSTTVADDTPRWSIVSHSQSHLPRSKWDQASCILCIGTWVLWKKVPVINDARVQHRGHRNMKPVISAFFLMRLWSQPHGWWRQVSSQQTIVLHPCRHSLISSSNYVSEARRRSRMD